ncbi:hypothetical protein [Streptomyces sp. NPDC005096]|uniref:hypothetical protein n=1 Tax=Streptomyces sp. NPDC005096 TaxID=3154559 RepID=UPI0033B1FBB2
MSRSRVRQYIELGDSISRLLLQHLARQERFDELARQSQPRGLAPMCDEMIEEITAEVDAVVADDRMARIRRDTAKVTELADHDFKGAVYKDFEAQLCLETWPVLRGMLRSRKLIHLAMADSARLGRSFFVLSEDAEALHNYALARDEILVDVVVSALKSFRKNALVGGGWNPNFKGKRGPCCLATWFIRLCILELPQHYTTWAKKQRKIAKHEAMTDGVNLSSIIGQTGWDVSEGEATRLSDEFESILGEQSVGTQAVVRWWCMGYQQNEIAEQLHINTATVRQRMARFKRVLYDAARERRIWIPEQLHTASPVGTKTQRGAV